MYGLLKRFFLGDSRDVANNRLDAFTLLEVVIAGAVFMLMALGFSAGMISAIRTQQIANDRYRATSIARDLIQYARKFNDFDEIKTRLENLSGQYYDLEKSFAYTNPERFMVNDVRDYRIHIAVSNINSSSDVKTADVTIDVYVPLRKKAGFSEVPVKIRTILSESDQGKSHK